MRCCGWFLLRILIVRPDMSYRRISFLFFGLLLLILVNGCSLQFDLRWDASGFNPKMAISNREGWVVLADSGYSLPHLSDISLVFLGNSSDKPQIKTFQDDEFTFAQNLTRYKNKLIFSGIDASGKVMHAICDEKGSPEAVLFPTTVVPEHFQRLDARIVDEKYCELYLEWEISAMNQSQAKFRCIWIQTDPATQQSVYRVIWPEELKFNHVHAACMAPGGRIILLGTPDFFPNPNEVVKVCMIRPGEILQVEKDSVFSWNGSAPHSFFSRNKLFLHHLKEDQVRINWLNRKMKMKSMPISDWISFIPKLTEETRRKIYFLGVENDSAKVFCLKTTHPKVPQKRWITRINPEESLLSLVRIRRKLYVIGVSRSENGQTELFSRLLERQ